MSDGWKGQGILENLDYWLKQVVGAQGILSDGGCAYCTEFAANASTFFETFSPDMFVSFTQT